MKRILILLALCLTLPMAADNVKQLQKQQKQLQKQIANTNKMLEQTKKNEKASTTKLELINSNIQNKKKLINSLGKEIKALDGEMASLTEQRNTLQTELEQLKDDYARLVRETHFAQLQQSPLIFLFSAKTFQQAIQRIRYMQEFAQYRRQQVAKIESAQADIDVKNEELKVNRSNKTTALQSQQKEQENLARDERKQKQMLDELKKKEKDLRAQLKKQQQKADALNKKIEDAIKKQVKEQQKTKLTKEQQLLAGGFEKNKGRLPWPVEQGTITRRFGKQQHPVYPDVVTENKGIYIQTVAGADVRSVYDGEVTSCFMAGSSYAVIIQHGNYRTVYLGLSKLAIKQGDKVVAKQKIGTAYTDSEQDNKTEIQFSIYQDKNLLNPEPWLTK